jgi:hypothetical protein
MPSLRTRIIRGLATLLIAQLPLGAASGQTLPLPPRPKDAPGGNEFAGKVSNLLLQAREREVMDQVLSGNVPDFLRKLSPVTVTNVAGGVTNVATYYVTPDYLAVGSEQDYFLFPISPNTAQRIADSLGCALPTPKMVNDIYRAADLKLPPSPIPPTAAMITVPVFSNHNAIVRAQRSAELGAHPLGALVAGHQKDIVISAKLESVPGKVAIYGWHQTNGVPIQPLYLKHAAAWVDYSQCTRLVQQAMLVNGATQSVSQVLADPALARLLSDEGVVAPARYPTNAVIDLTGRTNGAAFAPLSSTSPATNQIGFHGWTEHPNLQERDAWFMLEPDVKVRVNAPAGDAWVPGRKLLLIFYALPNGNTIEHTFGKVFNPRDDFHYNIQHIGAQTRFLRKLLTDRNVVVVYLESGPKSWPSWRKKNGDKGIPKLLAEIAAVFPDQNAEVVLSGHSGGGSMIFGYLNAVTNIPPEVVRIAFLDSNYAYNAALGHEAKLARWLSGSNQRCLCILAYNDAVALLDGTNFVSAAGGTWGKSHAMQRDLAEDFSFITRTNADFQRFTALDGRIQFILKENPGKDIFHTVQVERNGFIHCMVSGTTNENKGYEYFGPRAYSEWIRPN